VIEPRDHGARQTSLKEYALLAPRLIKLLVRLMRDPRVQPRSKALLLVTVGYLVSPIDVIPDMVPGVGQLDDIIIVAFALDHLLNRIPEELVQEHWDGDEDILEVVRHVVEIGAGLVPTWIKRFLPG
jgi:uncharacterized membrane protein YkvA (DUF1232 family)